MKKHPKLRKIIILLVVCAVLCMAAIAITNLIVVNTTKNQIVAADAVEPADCILVLGCGLRSDGYPGERLRDRLDTGIELYKAGKAPKLLMSGDHGRVEYDEVNAMKRYAVEQGVPSEDVFMDHAGFSTYESMVRARNIFGVNKLVVVTQQYHLYRAIWNARHFGMEAQGVASDLHQYVRQRWYDLREVLARTKDVLFCAVQASPTYLGDTIPITADGNLTNDTATKTWLTIGDGRGWD